MKLWNHIYKEKTMVAVSRVQIPVELKKLKFPIVN